jgi:multisubunit Na+/H+ antiporter MnhE subunit
MMCSESVKLFNFVLGLLVHFLFIFLIQGILILAIVARFEPSRLRFNVLLVAWLVVVTTPAF